MTYVWDEQDKFFLSSNGRRLAYSDGLEAEYRLEEVIRRASDRSVSVHRTDSSDK